MVGCKSSNSANSNNSVVNTIVIPDIIELDESIAKTLLGVQKPTNIYIEFDFLVNRVRQTFEAGFNLSW